MPRFYFHLLGSIRWEDEQGCELPGMDDACLRAIERAGEIDGGRASGLSIQVTGEDGKTIFAVSAGQPPGSGRFWLH